MRCEVSIVRQDFSAHHQFSSLNFEITEKTIRSGSCGDRGQPALPAESQSGLVLLVYERTVADVSLGMKTQLLESEIQVFDFHMFSIED